MAEHSDDPMVRALKDAADHLQTDSANRVRIVNRGFNPLPVWVREITMLGGTGYEGLVAIVEEQDPHGRWTLVRISDVLSVTFSPGEAAEGSA